MGRKVEMLRVFAGSNDLMKVIVEVFWAFLFDEL
jgi:hypothetical protein